MIHANARTVVSVGFACNNRCVFCAQGDLRIGPDAIVPDAEVRARIAAARPAAAVTLAGGEPTTREALGAWAMFAHDVGFSTVQVQTNGRRLSYRRYADGLRAAGVDDLDVSLHGHEAAVHDWHVRVAGAFEQTTAGIANAVATGMRVVATSVVTRSSYRHLPEIVRLASRLGVDAIHLAAALPRGGAEVAFDGVVPRFALLAEPLGEALSVARRFGLAALVSGVPSCFLGEAAALRTDFPAGAMREHGPACGECSHRGACPGAPAEYLRRFGAQELVARRDRPTPSVPCDRFAGPGPMEAVRPERLPNRIPPVDLARARLRELGKPAPAADETRGAGKKTGDALEEILPALFEQR